MARSRHAPPPVDLHARLTGQRLQRFATQQPQHHVALPAGAPPLPRRQGARPGRRPVGTDSSRPPGSLRPRRSLCLYHVPRPNHFPHLLGHWTLPDALRRHKKHLTPFFGGRRMASISTPDVRTYTSHRLDAGASPGEVNRELTLLKRAFSLAVQAGKLFAKPHIPLLREDNIRTGLFEPHEIEAVLRHLPADLTGLVRFLWITGWRVGEVLPLQWRQVDLASRDSTLERPRTARPNVPVHRRPARHSPSPNNGDRRPETDERDHLPLGVPSKRTLHQELPRGVA